jgi:SOS-response transcriptional repressor LexA
MLRHTQLIVKNFVAQFVFGLRGEIMNNDLMKKIGNRLKQRRTSLGLSMRALCERIEQLGGNLDYSNMSRIESGKQWPGETTLNLILKALQCSGLEELFLYTANHHGFDQAKIGIRKLSLIKDSEVTAYMKNNNFVSDQFVFTERNLSLKAFALNITDDSMAPIFRKGDAVVIDPEVKPEPGDFVVASIGEDSYFRQYKMRGFDSEGGAIFDLSPLNDVFHTISSDISQGTEIVGTMVEHRIFYKK